MSKPYRGRGGRRLAGKLCSHGAFMVSSSDAAVRHLAEAMPQGCGYELAAVGSLLEAATGPRATSL